MPCGQKKSKDAVTRPCHILTTESHRCLALSFRCHVPARIVDPWLQIGHGKIKDSTEGGLVTANATPRILAFLPSPSHHCTCKARGKCRAHPRAPVTVQSRALVAWLSSAREERGRERESLANPLSPSPRAHLKPSISRSAIW
jgi:hypothetical protein